MGLMHMEIYYRPEESMQWQKGYWAICPYDATSDKEAMSGVCFRFEDMAARYARANFKRFKLIQIKGD